MKRSQVLHARSIPLLVLVALGLEACAPAAPVVVSPSPAAPVASAPSPAAPVVAMPSPTVKYRAPTYGEITPGPHKFVGDLSTVIQVPPFAYSRPLPPPLPTALDGLYTRTIPYDGTPTPCKRCAGYRIEGGVWSLYLENGVFKFFHQETDFEAVGSYSVSGDQVMFFNDPYCEENLSMVGSYTWTKEGDTLTFKVANDPCSIGLRAKNLTATVWTRTTDPCQPPNREAAVTDHWKKPAECDNPATPVPN